jgi:hypothetical protein
MSCPHILKPCSHREIADTKSVMFPVQSLCIVSALGLHQLHPFTHFCLNFRRLRGDMWCANWPCRGTQEQRKCGENGGPRLPSAGMGKVSLITNAHVQWMTLPTLTFLFCGKDKDSTASLHYYTDKSGITSGNRALHSRAATGFRQCHTVLPQHKPTPNHNPRGLWHVHHRKSRGLVSAAFRRPIPAWGKSFRFPKHLPPSPIILHQSDHQLYTVLTYVPLWCPSIQWHSFAGLA